MTSQEAKTKLIALIVKNGVNIPSYQNRELEHSHNKYGSWSLDFVLKYDAYKKNYVSATHLNPEEYDFVLSIEDVEEIEVYVNNDQILLNDKDLTEIEEAILIACNKEL
jgi:hypothetical protein